MLQSSALGQVFLPGKLETFESLNAWKSSAAGYLRYFTRTR